MNFKKNIKAPEDALQMTALKVFLLILFLYYSICSASGQTLQTVTDNGNTTTTRIISNPIYTVGSRFTAYGTGNGYFDIFNNENNSISLSLRRSDGALAFHVNGHTMMSSFGGDVETSGSISASSINTSSPSFSGASTPTSIFSLSGFRINGTIPGSSHNAITYQSGGGGGAAIGFYRGGSYDTGIDFYTNSEVTPSFGTLNHRMRINADGNVSIGTTDTQGHKLAVAGSVVAESVSVKLQTSWPDYVFSSSHKLTSLNALESFIRENQHLPEIPSASEVATKGLNLGEMNAKLLKKIEELTLYIINQNKKQEIQNKKLSDLEEEVQKLKKMITPQF